MVKALIVWDKILSPQIRITLWMDLKGKTQMKEHAKTKKSFNDCVKHHLLTIFSDDAAEKKKST